LDFASPLLFAASAVAADMMKKRSPQKQHRSEPAEAGESFAPARKLDNLSRKQKREVDEQSRPNAALIHETIRAEGESELERTWWALGLSGLAAGLSIGLSMVLQGELHAHLPDGAAVKTIAPFGYTAGFVIVVLGRQQLFTENTLTPILPLLHNRVLPTARKVLALWAMVHATNIAGAFLFAAAIIHSHAFEAAITSAFSADARHLVEGSFGVTVVRAILAGWLIALMVWLLPAAESSRLLVIICITYIIRGHGRCRLFAANGRSVSPRFVRRIFHPHASWQRHRRRGDGRSAQLRPGRARDTRLGVSAYNFNFRRRWPSVRSRSALSRMKPSASRWS
jgi:formate/nitrite transporter FocA (FNT family)